MSSQPWTEQWRHFLGSSPTAKPLEILRRLYIDENRHAAILTQHASRMQYPQFRVKLLEIAEQERHHGECIGEKIKLLGGSLPVVRPITLADGNSWELLLEDLKSESRCAGALQEEASLLEAEFPAVAGVLRRIYQEEQKHREEIRAMLMRSDPLSRHAA